MSDLPNQGDFQQAHARRVSGEHLEVLGKHAAAKWSSGEYSTLTEAVTETVKKAQLSPEQVKRVCEFANTSAFLGEFKKEGMNHRVVDFDAGPANPSDIIKDLNDGGGGSVFDRGTSDYNQPPDGKKTASAEDESALAEAFSAREVNLPYADPLHDIVSLKDKLAGAVDHIHAQVSGLEVAYGEVAARTYHEVKQAALSGVPLGDIMFAWQTVAPSDDHIKVAFSLMAPRLLREGVFNSLEQMTESVDAKTASAQVVNKEHPLIGEFSEFCDVITKLAELRVARQELRSHLSEVNTFIKNANLIGKSWDGLTSLTRGAGEAAAPFVSELAGPTAGKVVGGAIKYAPHMAAGVAGMEAYTHLKHSQNPVARGARAVVNTVNRNIPGTQANQQHIYDVMTGGGNPYGF